MNSEFPPSLLPKGRHLFSEDTARCNLCCFASRNAISAAKSSTLRRPLLTASTHLDKVEPKRRARATLPTDEPKRYGPRVLCRPCPRGLPPNTHERRPKKLTNAFPITAGMNHCIGDMHNASTRCQTHTPRSHAWVHSVETYCRMSAPAGGHEQNARTQESPGQQPTTMHTPLPEDSASENKRLQTQPPQSIPAAPLRKQTQLTGDRVGDKRSTNTQTGANQHPAAMHTLLLASGLERARACQLKPN